MTTLNRLMALGLTKMGTPVPICLARTDVPPSLEATRFFRRVWTEDRYGRVVKVHKDNIGGLRPGDHVATDVDAQKVQAGSNRTDA